MSIPREPTPAKLVISHFMQDKQLLGEVVKGLSKSFGPVDIVSSWLPFDQTDYYAAEMGRPLFRRLTSFGDLIKQDALSDIKCFTNELESRFSDKGNRLVNIDPGYIMAERFVLATGKNYTHRIYLKAGIYADLTLIYYKGRFRALSWTYPDYAGERIIRFLQSIRDKYMFQLGHAQA
ncbi:MAG: DUF4416 family protein [Deltaproteobacteria bacterium]|jgi:hypothetical protein